MNKAQNECTCPSGDGSLRWPCPAHPAVEQAGGDERAAFKTAYLAEFDCDADGDDNMAHSNTAWRAWKMARAALAQPSPKCVKCGGTGEADSGGVHPWGEPVLIPCDCETEQAEAERPEVVAVVESNGCGGKVLAQRFPIINVFVGDKLMTVAQHERIVGALRAEITQLRQHKNDYMDAGQETYRALQNEIRDREAEIARLDGLVSSRTTERDAALARVAELEKQEPVALANRGLHAFWVKWTEAAAGLYGPGIKLYAAPVVQAQHSVPEISGIGRDAEHPRAVVLYLRNEPSDEDMRAIQNFLRAMLAAAPGKEVPQAWLDVQAERRRQVEAEGWTPEHDDLYCAAELPRAAAAYILNGANDEAPAIWPFSAKWWKPRDARSNYVRASALILAEIERLDRAAPGKEGV
ncbi:hypothetical protein PALA5_04718 [Pseudomonas aeruginosa]|uniref:hypothetical protein n=1 Tax=Pseudomonas aeruginosa TaxID=287 RepID=UPI0022DADDEC|nr:hypothetical protein [Pseudomonas aeruginosa]MDA1465461.1 hypothetical protein [Pseudomonas aeruginosa]